MTDERKPRERLLDAAATLLASEGTAVSTRAICEAAGVTAPTLYHYFGDRAGLLDAVISHGFGAYLAEKRSVESTDDPIEDLRRGWDNHIAWGVANPSFYVLMFGQGIHRAAAGEASALLVEKLLAAGRAGLLLVPPELAVDVIMSANAGLTLRLIAGLDIDSTRVRDAVFSGLLRTDGPTDAATAAITLRSSLPSPAITPAEQPLLEQWLDRLASA